MTRRLPPEWAPQEAVLLTWPHGRGDWGSHLAAAEKCLLDIAREIARHERLIIACLDEAHLDHVAGRLSETGIEKDRARLLIAPSNDIWVRDHGPITLFEDHHRLLLDFHFNGWGGKYPSELDDRVTRVLHQKGAFGELPLLSVDLVLEGGAIDTDGRGSLLTTRSCLLNPNRNPGLAKEDIERRLGELLGVERIHWLAHGRLAGDDTDGHVDTLARFCAPGLIAWQGCEDRDDEHFEPLQQMGRELARLRDARGQPYECVALPLPAPILDETGRRLPAGYANFLIINGAVLVPAYGDPADERACRILDDCFPGRSILPIDCRPLIRQYGSLHCATMQLPKAPES